MWHDKHCPECSVAAIHSSVDLLFGTILLCFSLPLHWLCTRQMVVWLSEFMAQILVTTNKWFRKLHQIPPLPMVGGFQTVGRDTVPSLGWRAHGLLLFFFLNKGYQAAVQE